MQDALLLLAHEVIQMHVLARGSALDFATFLRDWRAVRVAWDGSRSLSLWRGPDDARIAILCDSAPDWHIVSVADYSLAEASPRPQPKHRSFLLPGDPVGWWGDCLCQHGIFLGWWPALDGAQALRLIRQGLPIELTAEADEFVLIDWRDPAPVDRFDATLLPGTGWEPTLAPWVPYAAAQLWPAYVRLTATLPKDVWGADQWAYEVFSAASDDWINLIVAALSVADAERDADALLQFGAHIYGNNAAFFTRLNAEIDAGTLNPEAVGLVLSMERPEYLDPPALAIFRRLEGRCGQLR